MKLDISRADLTAKDIPRYLLLRSDPGNIRMAGLAAARLRVLFKSFQSSDLLRRAALMPNGAAWLARLAEDAGAVHEALKAERHEAATLLDADHLTRHRHDGAAMALVVAAEDQLRALKGRREAIVREESELRESMARARMDEATVEVVVERHRRNRLRLKLSRAGFADAEVDEILAGGAGEVDDDELAEIALQVGVEETRRDALLEFVRDPLRRLHGLPEPLRAEVLVRAEQMEASRAPRTAPLTAFQEAGPFAEPRPAR